MAAVQRRAVRGAVTAQVTVEVGEDPRADDLIRAVSVREPMPPQPPDEVLGPFMGRRQGPGVRFLNMIFITHDDTSMSVR